MDEGKKSVSHAEAWLIARIVGLRWALNVMSESTNDCGANWTDFCMAKKKRWSMDAYSRGAGQAHKIQARLDKQFGKSRDLLGRWIDVDQDKLRMKREAAR